MISHALPTHLVACSQNPEGVIIDGKSFASILPKPGTPPPTKKDPEPPVHEFLFYWREHVLCVRVLCCASYLLYLLPAVV
mgnify:CR=1 FL=1